MNNASDYNKYNDYVFLSKKYLAEMKRVRALSRICSILFIIASLIFFFLYQWVAMGIFAIGSIILIILWRGTAKAITKAKYEDDLEEVYKDERLQYDKIFN